MPEKLGTCAGIALGLLLFILIFACIGYLYAPDENGGNVIEKVFPPNGLEPVCNDPSGVKYWVLDKGAYSQSIMPMTERQAAEFCN